MKQIKLIKDWKSGKAKEGDIINIADKDAEELVKNGYAEYQEIKKNRQFECSNCFGTSRTYDGSVITKCLACKIGKIKEVEFEEPNREVEGKPKIQIPQNKLISEFAEEILPYLRQSEDLFYNEQVKSIVQIKNNQFRIVTASEFITIIERHITPFVYNMRNELSEKSISKELSNTLLQSDIIKEGLKPIRQIFSIPIPIIYKDKLTFVRKGYDDRFNSWLSYDSPDIINPGMPLDEAKEIIEYIFKEFAFKDKQDKSNAIASLLTPFTKGLMSSFSVRTPLTFYMANRERAGKDYCADITGIVYEGYSLQEPPISTGENSNSSEELRKKVVSALLTGKKRLHFANNKGYLNNAVLEMLLTSQKISDRILGKNVQVELDNLIDYSASGNVGIGFTPDLMNRCLFVNLFLDIENANLRKFENPNLHLWILENRAKILSAFFSLIRNWFDLGKRKGDIPFASYPEWANIVGGIMESAGYLNPCNPHEQVLAVGGDTETQDMKELFEICFEKCPNKEIDKSQIKYLIQEAQSEGSSIFGYLDFNNKSDQTKFGTKLIKFVGRILSDIRLESDGNPRKARQKYKFVKVSGNLVTSGNLYPCQMSKDDNIDRVVEKVAYVTKVTKKQELNEPLEVNELQ